MGESTPLMSSTLTCVSSQLAPLNVPHAETVWASWKYSDMKRLYLGPEPDGPEQLGPRLLSRSVAEADTCCMPDGSGVPCDDPCAGGGVPLMRLS